ncbi:MAG: carbamoyl phosphate synthase small subunit [Acidobacteria bacterium]|nr:MAG: carbamoyl phosphate synthase small subunit [Acidobacteriota bacterium]
MSGGTPAVLALADGAVFRGLSAGAQLDDPATGEVVFNTALTGYQEIITDPSYAGQIVAMTYPHIGNYGVNDADAESRRIFASGLVVRDLSEDASSWRSEGRLDEYLKERGISAIKGVDTRRLTRHIRDHGSMTGAICHGDVADGEAVEVARQAPSILGVDLVSSVTTDKPYTVAPKGEARFHMAAYDFGIKARILDSLALRGVRVTVLPAMTPHSEITSGSFDGVFLSNGPGDPSAVGYAIENTRALLGAKPVFGICLGHQIIGLALGGSTYKLHFGHHGGNHPVRHASSGRVEITSQNHGFAVDPASLGGHRIEGAPWEARDGFGMLASRQFGAVRPTHSSLNDGTLEGLECMEIAAMSVQYHPEAAPGPNDASYLFDVFVEMIERCR